MVNLNHYLQPQDIFISYCDSSHNKIIYSRIEKDLKNNHQLKGEAFKQAFQQLTLDYEKRVQSFAKTLDLKKFVKLTNQHLQTIKSSESRIMTAGKLHLMLMNPHSHSSEKVKSSLFSSTIEEKAIKLLDDLKAPKIYSEKELSDYFFNKPLETINETMKYCLGYLSPKDIENYAKKDLFHLNEGVLFNDNKLASILENLTSEQRKAFFQGILQLKNPDKMFKQLFCALTFFPDKKIELLEDCFPIKEYVDYLSKNLGKIKKLKFQNINTFYLESLQGLVIDGRMNRSAEIVIKYAIKFGDYVGANNLLNTMKYSLHLEKIKYSLLSTQEIDHFRSNSSIRLLFEKQKDYTNLEEIDS